MVLGLRKKSPSATFQVDYLIHLQEIKPWPPSQSLRSLRSVYIQWENGNRNSGATNHVVPSLGSGSSSGRIEFNESFKLSVTLQREISIKSPDNYTFQKNYLEFNLYEPRRDKTVKGQLLGSVIVDLAEYGIVKDSLSISAPMNCKRSLTNTAQPILFLNIQTVGKSHNKSVLRDGLLRESSMERSVGESVSALMNEEYAEEAEDDISSYSSNEASSSSFESNMGSPSLKDSNGSKDMKGTEGEEKYDKFVFPSNQRFAKLDLMPVMEPHNINRKVNLQASSSADLSPDFENQENIQSNSIEDLNGQCSLTSIAYEEIDKALNREIKEDMMEKDQETGQERSGVNGNTFNNCRSNSRRCNGSVRKERKEDKVSPKETRIRINERKVQVLEERVQMLEAELREAAATEVSLYSVVAEHGSSTTKVHAPARRLSRLYFHAHKENSRSRIASAAKSALSGLVLVAKACGYDVPRLTFWLSNSVVLRAIITHGFKERADNGKGETEKSTLKWKDSSSSTETINTLHERFEDWEDPLSFTSALEKIESWIFTRIIESVWWQTFTPYMQSDAAKGIAGAVGSHCREISQLQSVFSSDQEQVNFSTQLWKNAFRDSYERICPVRAGGHECGCLSLLSRLIMEECVSRLDVAMFNAILRESADQIPTDPVSDPISHPQVLPIPPGNASFGAGAQLKSAVGNWTQWLGDLLCIEENYEDNEVEEDNDTSFKPFYLLTALSDLMMLPKDMILSQSIRKEVCPKFGITLIKRILNTFVPDEFCPEPIPHIVIESLDSVLDASETCEDSVLCFPCGAASIVYKPPSAALLVNIFSDGVKNGSHLTRSGSLVLRKSYMSDDELDELDSPLTSIVGLSMDSHSSARLGWMLKGNGSGNEIRFQLLRDVWVNSEL